ncbi:MAG: hypothetical protein JWN80_2963 [Microbacteriaceae bacterium]|nr:hypothetical protein [Microbacteriaceae bacterium]
MSQMFEYAGVIPILPTPFFDDDRVDIDSLLRVVEFSHQVGASAITLLGVLGESHLLTDRESTQIVSAVLESGIPIPVIVGASRPGTFASRVLADQASDLGAAAVMIAPPSVAGISETAIRAYFDGVGSGPLPIVIQDHPASTGVQMSVELLANLVDRLPRVAGVKVEAVPTAPKLRALRALLPEARLLTGLGALYGATDLAAGSDGFNTGFAFPEVLIELCRLRDSGELAGARRLFRHFLPLIVLEQHPGPALRKEVWRLRGRLSTARVRAPGAQLDAFMAEELLGTLQDTLDSVDLRQPLSDFGPWAAVETD